MTTTPEPTPIFAAVCGEYADHIHTALTRPRLPVDAHALVAVLSEASEEEREDSDDEPAR